MISICLGEEIANGWSKVALCCLGVTPRQCQVAGQHWLQMRFAAVNLHAAVPARVYIGAAVFPATGAYFIKAKGAIHCQKYKDTFFNK